MLKPLLFPSSGGGVAARLRKWRVATLVAQTGWSDWFSACAARTAWVIVLAAFTTTQKRKNEEESYVMKELQRRLCCGLIFRNVSFSARSFAASTALALMLSTSIVRIVR